MTTPRGRSRRQKLRPVVFGRADYRCQACGSPRTPLHPLTIDHVHPLSKGGTWDLDNLQALCKPCNEAKADA